MDKYQGSDGVSKAMGVVKHAALIPDCFWNHPGIGVVFPFPDITIVEEKGSADYFRFFRFPFPCT